MTDEERAAAEAGDPSRPKSPNPSAAAASGVVSTDAHAAPAATRPLQPSVGPSLTPDSATRTDSGVVKHEASGAATPTSAGAKDKDKDKDKKGRSKLSPEQRKKLDELDLQRKKVMEERYAVPRTSRRLV